VTDLRRRLGDRPHRIVPAGVIGDDPVPVHRPRTPRRHRCRRIGAVDVWTADTCDGYFATLMSGAAGPQAPVWPAYGPGQPVFTFNTNDFDERPPAAHDDYAILGSGLLGLRMVLESGPAASARVYVYDINPDQLAWCQFVLARCGRVGTLNALVRLFAASRPDVTVRDPLPHETANVARQADWYAANRHALAGLTGVVEFHWLVTDLLTRPADVLSVLRPDRSVYFMYLDLFVVWNTRSASPWIIQFPDHARSLEIEVRRLASSAAFLPGPHSRVLQLGESPIARLADGD
jgi:hypothetical protein